MHIQIKDKFLPFSHRPGIRMMVPYTVWEVQVFPAKLIFKNLETGDLKQESLSIQGPVKGFTALLHLEKGRVEVFGRGKEGYFRYFITPEEFSFMKKVDLPLSRKRLSLGVHKKQDWDLIQRRGDLAEIFPFWMRLRDMIPKMLLPKQPIGTSALLEKNDFAAFIQAGFQGILSPTLEDENYLGLIPELKTADCPIGLIHEGARRMEKLFFLEERDQWYFLPSLPKEFHAGRFIYLETKTKDIVHIEWSKKELKKVIIHPAASREIQPKFQSRLKSYRLRTNPNQKGTRISCKEPLELISNRKIYLDNFQH